MECMRIKIKVIDSQNVQVEQHNFRNGHSYNTYPLRTSSAAYNPRERLWQDHRRGQLLHLLVVRNVVCDQGLHGLRPSHTTSGALIITSHWGTFRKVTLVRMRVLDEA